MSELFTSRSVGAWSGNRLGLLGRRTLSSKCKNLNAKYFRYGQEDDDAHRRCLHLYLREETRAGPLQHEPEQGDDGELVPEIRDAQPQPKPLECGMAQWSANSSRFITFYFYVLSLEYPQTLSSSI